MKIRMYLGLSLAVLLVPNAVTARPAASVAFVAGAPDGPPVPSNPATAPAPRAPHKLDLTAMQVLLSAAAFRCNPALAQPAALDITWSGACVDRKLDGPGELVIHEGANSMTMSGNFARGIAEGHQEMRFGSDSAFSGEFHGSLPNGAGTIKSEGVVVATTFQDGIAQGSAHIVYGDSGSSDVVFKDGFRDGVCRFVYGDVHGETFYRGGLRDGLLATTYGDGGRLEVHFDKGAWAPMVAFVTAKGEHFTGMYATAKPPTGAASIPDYPAQAARLDEHGVVLLRHEISDRGTVINVAIIKSSGYDDLDQAAVAWLRARVYQPAMVGDHPVPESRTIKVPFILHDAEPTLLDRMFGAQAP